MKALDSEFDPSVATLDGEKPGWQPSQGVAHHAGMAIDPQLDFFAPPPSEIGEIVTAASTLKTTKRPMPVVSRILLCGLVASVGVAALYLFDLKEPILEVLVAVPLAWLTWYFTRFRHECSYVGKLGTARRFCKGNRSNVYKEERFLFDDAAELRTSQTRHYTNGVYTGTSYSHVWTDAEGKKRYKLAGKYTGERKPPRASQSPFHSLRRRRKSPGAASLLERALEELNTKGAIRFNVGRNNWVAIGSGFIDLHMDGHDARCTREEIAGISLNGGIFEIKRFRRQSWLVQQNRRFLLRRYGQMANSRLFLLALDKLLGFRFS